MGASEDDNMTITPQNETGPYVAERAQNQVAITQWETKCHDLGRSSERGVRADLTGTTCGGLEQHSQMHPSNSIQGGSSKMEKQVRFFNLFGVVVRDDIGGAGPVATYAEMTGERTMVEVNTLEPVPVRELDHDWKQWVQEATTHGFDEPGKEEAA